MVETDFSQCELINNEMWFFTYIDFVENRFVLKKLFDSLDKNGKIFYKYYVYANIHMNETFKNAIWDYLNDGDPIALNLLKLVRIYKAK